MRFRAEGGAHLAWVLDGEALGPADGSGVANGWTPAPGRHELKLVGADGRTAASARFEVRGAGR
jgi:penicillin-binding protein 1C